MENNLIITDFERLDEKLIEKFKGLGTSDIDDSMGKNAAFSSSFMRFGQGKLCGSAFTIKLVPGDNLVLAAAMDIAKPGDILVIDDGNDTERAIVGDLLATYSASKGIQGMILTGAVRDVVTLNEMENFAVYGKSISPNGPFKKEAGSMNTPIMIDNMLVNPGDLIIGDEDGIILIKKEEAEAVLEKALAMTVREEGLIKMARSGINPRPISLEDLEKAGCIISKKNAKVD